MADLAIFTVTVRPTHHDVIPAHTGRAAHALFLAALRDVDPILSEIVHGGSQLRPLTASPLLPAPRGGTITLAPTQRYTLRFTTLHADLTRLAENALAPRWLRSGLILHDQPLRVESIDVRCTSYADLLRNTQTGRRLPRWIALSFNTPTVIKKTGDIQLPLPVPANIFGSLIDRWMAFAPSEAALPDGLRDWVDRCVSIEDLNIRSQHVSFERANRGHIIGFVGTVTFTAVESSNTFLPALHALADYAAFAGVGAKTAMGLGQVVRSAENAPKRSRRYQQDGASFSGDAGAAPRGDHGRLRPAERTTPL
ncbi:MAG: CRISPR system precrRNA processing endoribonuclease RAMP protein Cas6 [Aggregatilineales bacterium]